jgi:hypothetical protein
MFNLEDKNISYILISPEKENKSLLDKKNACDKLQTILYSKEYTIIPVTGYYQGNYERSFIAVTADDNDTIRKDAIFLLDEFDQESVIVKYKGETSPVKILNNGSEKLLSISIYGDDENKSYLYNGVSFSFMEKKRYKFLSDKSQLRVGMVVEFLNNDRWIEKEVVNLDSEYDKLYKLLIKYGKLRTAID